MRGIVYILTNQAMPGFVKIGKTESALSDRIRSLNNTSVPFEFECYYAAIVENCSLAERLLHDAFADHRPNPRREFFTLDPERARSALRLAAVEEVTPTIEEIIPDAAERSAVTSMAQRRRETSLTDIGVCPGDVLQLDRAPDITCEVIDDKSVNFRGEAMSLSQSAVIALNELGFEWTRANGWRHWMHDGRTLRDLVTEHLSD